MRKKLVIVAVIVVIVLIVILQPERQCISIGIFATHADAEQRFRQAEGNFEAHIFHIIKDVAEEGGPVQMWICK